MSLRRNAGYALPALPLAALYFPVFVYIAPFYSAERGVSLGALGTLFLLVRLMDAVTDPAMGWLSDRTRSRVGRRRVWLIVATPLICISVWMLLAPPPDAGLLHVSLWLTLLTLSWTVALTPYFAWGAEISGDYGDRAAITGWREGMTLVGTVVAAIVYFIAGDAEAGLRSIALMVIIGMPITVAIAIWAVPEPRDHSRQRLDVKRAMRAISGNALFRRLLGAYFINGLANGLPPALFLFFLGDLLGAPDANWLLLVYFGCAVMGLPIWAWAAKKYSKHRAWSVAMIIALIIFAPAVLLTNGDLMIFTAICVATGLTLGADLSLPASIQADVVDKDTADTGEQRTGLFFALWSVATKAALAVSGGVALLLLDFAGFQSGAENSETALFTLAALYALAPAVLKIFAVMLMWNFPLGPEEQRALRAKIEATT